MIPSTNTKSVNLLRLWIKYIKLSEAYILYDWLYTKELSIQSQRNRNTKESDFSSLRFLVICDAFFIYTSNTWALCRISARNGYIVWETSVVRLLCKYALRIFLPAQSKLTYLFSHSPKSLYKIAVSKLKLRWGSPPRKLAKGSSTKYVPLLVICCCGRATFCGRKSMPKISTQQHVE